MSQNGEKTGLSGQFDRKAQHVELGLFVPPAEDSSNVVINFLAARLVSETKINLRIFCVDQKHDPRIDLSTALQKKSFLHSGILRDVVFPMQRKLGLTGNPDGVLLCPELLVEQYSGRIFLEHVPDVNDPTFIQERIRENTALQMAVSVRNLQIFKDKIIAAFAEKGPARLLNSHPALLPTIRGLEGPFWSRVRGLQEYTTTLHVVERQIDAGPILDYETIPVNGSPDRPVAFFTRDVAPKVADMIFKHAHLRLVRNGSHPGLTMQDEADASYHTIPTPEELDIAKKQQGIILTQKGGQIQWLLEQYASVEWDSEHHAYLLSELISGYDRFKKSLNSRILPDEIKECDGSGLDLTRQ